MANNFCYACSPCPDQTITTIITEQLAKVEDMPHVDALIEDIDKLLTAIGGGLRYLDRSESVASFIKSVSDPIQNRLKRLNWHVCKKCLFAALDIQTMKAVNEVLKLCKHMECATIMLSITVYLLERGEQVSSNKDQCLRLLRYITALAKHMKALDTRLEQTKLEDILRFIVKATVICALQMATNSCCRFMCAPLDNVDLKELESELRDTYQDLEFQTIIGIFEKLPAFPPPTQGEYPHDAVGIQSAQDELTRLLNVEHSDHSSSLAVVIHGVRDIGKTILARAVFSSLNLKGYLFCRVMLDHGCTLSDLKDKQEQILRHVFKRSLKLNDSTEGQEILLQAFRKASLPVFLFIDNVSRKSDLELLLPVRYLSACQMPRRILITTRNVDEACIFQTHHGIEVCAYDVATRPACREIVETYNERRQRVQNEGPQRGFGGEEDRIKQERDELTIIRMVDYVFHKLTQPSQEAFLDIVFYFCDWQRNKVAYIVGEMELQELKPVTELDTPSKEEKVKMHDIVRVRGRELSEGNRITDIESLVNLLDDDQQLQQTKGIWLRDDDSDISLEARHVALMSSSLRVLSLGKRRRLNGRWDGAFEELRFLEISFEDMSSIQLRESRELRFLIVHLQGRRAECTISLPQSLRYLEVDASDCPAFLHINGDITSLRGFHLSPNITLRIIEPALDNHPNGEIMPANVLQGMEQITIR